LTVGTDSPQFRANNGANGGVLNLQLERMRETIGINLYPETAELAKVQPPPGVRPVVQLLLNEMQAEEPGLRFAALQRLGILRPQGVAEQLANVMLRDTHDEVRMLAALTLASSATPETVPMLLEALPDRFLPVGHAAHVTLEHMTGNVDAWDVLPRERMAYWQTWLSENSPEQIESTNARALDGPFDWTNSAASIQFRKAVEALSHYGKSEAVKESLRKVLAEQTTMDTLSKIAVIRTLGILRDEKSVPLLTEILVECSLKKRPPARGSHEFGWTAMPDHIGGAAAEALGRIQTQAALDGLVRGFETLEEFWFYTFRTADHDWLMGSVSAIIHFRILEAFEAIGTSTTLDVKTPIRSLADKIVRSVPIDSDRGILLDNDDYERLVGRIIALGNYSHDYIEACLNVLEGKPGDEIKMRAVSDSPPAVSTGILERPSRAASLISVLVDEQTTPEHRARIRNAFESFRSREPSRERSWTCYLLARALGRMKDKESIPFLLSALNDEKREFDFGSPPPPNIFLTHAMTPVHRASAAAALGMIGDPVALPTLLAIAEDFNNMMDVRDAAASAMIDIGRQIDSQAISAHKEFIDRLKIVSETYPELYPGKTLSRAYKVWSDKL
jgi:HEAT repeat protein